VGVLVDTSVLIDHLRGHPKAVELLAAERLVGPVHASEITRLDVLAGMRVHEQERTRVLLSVLHWHPVDEHVAEKAGELGRLLPSHGGIDSADLAVAATAIGLDARLLTLNVRHYPMFDPRRPY